MDERRDSETNSDEAELSDFLEIDEVESERRKFGRRNRLGDWSGEEQPLIVLRRWKRRATFRRIKLIEESLLSPLGPRRLEKLELLLRTLEGRKAWLEARLEHTIGLRDIVRAAIQRQVPNRRGRRPNEGRGSNRREEHNQGMGPP